ncbi:hypothetical protein D3C87_2043880 [compost metagenome]
MLSRDDDRKIHRPIRGSDRNTASGMIGIGAGPDVHKIASRNAIVGFIAASHLNPVHAGRDAD